MRVCRYETNENMQPKIRSGKGESCSSVVVSFE